MNKDLLPEFIIIATRTYGEVHKVTETDQVICYSWRDQSNLSADKAIEVIGKLVKEKGWKVTQEEVDEVTGAYRYAQKHFFTITYGKDKDKISLSRFTTGYGYSQRKGKLHIIRRSEPVLCISKHVYVFRKVKLLGRKRRVYQPRIYTGWYYNSIIAPYLIQALNCLEDVLKLYVSYRYMKDATIQATAFKKRYGFYPVQYGIYWHNMKGVGDISYNWLIQMGKNNVSGYCKMLSYRISEGAVNNIQNMSIDQLERPVENQVINNQLQL